MGMLMVWLLTRRISLDFTRIMEVGLFEISIEGRDLPVTLL